MIVSVRWPAACSRCRASSARPWTGPRASPSRPAGRSGRAGCRGVAARRRASTRSTWLHAYAGTATSQTSISTSSDPEHPEGVAYRMPLRGRSRGRRREAVRRRRGSGGELAGTLRRAAGWRWYARGGGAAVGRARGTGGPLARGRHHPGGLGLGRPAIATVQPVEILVAAGRHTAKVLARAVREACQKGGSPRRGTAAGTGLARTY